MQLKEYKSIIILEKLSISHSLMEWLNKKIHKDVRDPNNTTTHLDGIDFSVNHTFWSINIIVFEFLN